MAKSTVAVKFTGDASHLQGVIGKVEGGLGGLGRTAATAGKVAAAGLGVVAVGGVALGKQVLDLGAKLTAWRQKTATVFEGSAQDIRAWADKNNETFGLTDDELAGLAASFGDLLKPMGFTSDQAAAMAKDVIGLSGALSEWSGGTRSAAEVSEILSKAMLGERDGLKELGISISEADVAGRLAAKGQEKLTGAALEQAKAVATQELIFEKSTDAQKAYAEGGNKALRASNKLKAGFAELKERIAGGLLPVAISLAETFGKKVMPILSEVGGAIVAFVGAFQHAEDGVTSSGFPGFMEKLAISARETFDQISAKVREWWPKIVAGFQAVVGFVKQNWPSIQATIKSVIETVVSVVSGAVDLITTIWNNFGNNILSFVQRVWPAIRQVITAAMNIIQGVIKVITGLIHGDWSRVWEGIKQIVSGVWNAIQAIIKAALEVIRLAVGAALEVLGSIMKGAWDGIKSAVSGAWDSIKGFVSGGVDSIVGFVTAIPGRIAGAVDGAFDGLKDAFRSAINWVIQAWNDLGVPSFKIGGFDIPGPGPNVPSFTTPAIPFPDIPTLHRGGVFRAPRGAREGLALLEDGERVTSRTATRRASATGLGTQVIQLVVSGRVLAEVVAEHELSQARNRGET